MQCDERDVKRWMAKVKKYLLRYRHHPQFDDVVGSAYARMADALVKLPEGRADAEPIAIRAGWLGAMEFLRSPQNDQRHITRQGLPQPQLVSVEDLWQPEFDGYVRVADFAPRLIAWLAAREELADRGEPEQSILLLLAEGYTRPEIATKLGLGIKTVHWHTRDCPTSLYSRYRPKRGPRVCRHCGRSEQKAHGWCNTCYNYWRINGRLKDSRATKRPTAHSQGGD